MNTGEDDFADTSHIFYYHKYLLQKHGTGSVGALGWTEYEGQQARFAMLSRIGDMEGCSVLDAGCGHADLFSFLRSLYPSLTYYGCEHMPELLNTAAQRYKGEKGIRLWMCNFLQDPLPAADYVLASGSLNYRHKSDGFIFKAIRTLYEQCRRALGFNLLSGGADADPWIASYDKEEILRFCHSLSGKAELHDGYWKDDFTVFLYR